MKKTKLFALFFVPTFITLAALAKKPNVIVIMADDIGEKQNVLKANPDIVRRLQNHLQTFTNDISNNSRPAAFVENAKPLSK